MLLISALALAATALAAQADQDADIPAPVPAEPEILGQGSVSMPDRYEYCSSLSRDRRTLYIGIEHGDWQSIEEYRWDGERWTGRKPIVGSPDYNAHDPYLSPDEQRLYFITRARGSADLAYLTRNQAGEWGDPEYLSAPVNGPANDYYTSITNGGEVYFSSNRSQESYDIYSAPLSGEGEATLLPDTINTRAYEGDPYIDPDGRYLIFASNRRGGLGRGDLYLSIADGEGGWSDSIAFDDRVNTSGHELCPLVSLDGSAFMFTSNEDIRWVSAQIIEEMIAAHSAR